MLVLAALAFIGIFFLGVVALENLPGIVVAQGGGRGASDVEEEIHAYGEVGGVDESDSVLLDQIADVVKLLMPARSADDHVFAGFYAGSDVVNDAVRGGEIDDGVDVAEPFQGEGGARGVFFCAGNDETMLALGGYFRHQRSGLAAA